MSNQKNKILPYAQAAIEGQNIQSYAEYSGSTERQDGVKTGIANGDNFNRFAKQVSIMCASLAEYIVNNTDEGDLTDNLSVDQIALLMEKAIIAKQQKIEFMTQEDYDGITPDPKTLYMIESSPFPDFFAKSLNGVAPDGTGDIKYQIVKTVNTKAPDSNGNVQLEFTFSPDINTGLVGYPLSVKNGGTGTTDGFGWKNAYTDIEFNKKIGLVYPFTTQELVTAIIDTFLYTPTFLMVMGYRKDEQFITDFPTEAELGSRMIVNFLDNNQGYLEITTPFSLTTYICNISGGIAGPWIKTRNPDGTIPASCGGVLTKYENSYGTWTETLLETGEIMLEGNGTVSLDVTKIDANQIIADKIYQIKFNSPKKCIEGKIIGNGIYRNLSTKDILLWVSGGYNNSTGIITFNAVSPKTENHGNISNLKTGSILVDFIFKGILAQ